MAIDDKPVEMPVKITAVAVGVLQKPDGSVLYAQRPSGKVYAGWWEFPGGKRELGEPIEQTLVRELREELGIEVTQFAPWVIRDHVYPHATVQLHFFRVTHWIGEPTSREGQVLRWQDPNAAAPQPLLPAAIPVINWLELPARYLLTSASTLGIAGTVTLVGQQIQLGAGLVQLFEPLLNDQEVIQLHGLLSAELSHSSQHHLLVHQIHQHLFSQAVNGVHFDSNSLMACVVKPAAPLVGADCETAEQLSWAAALGLDFVVMSEQFFLRSSRASRLPVFALLQPNSATSADFLSLGAHGVCKHLLRVLPKL